MVGSRSKGDRSDSALVGGVLLNMRRRCGLLGDVWNLAVRSFPMGVLGPCALALVASMAGGCGAAWFEVEGHLGVRRHVQDAASVVEGAVSLGFDFSLSGQVVPGSL
jgi:hypothetical protein